MKIHHLNCGTFCPLGERLINGHGSFLRRGKLVCHCLLIETETGLVLVDTGLGTADVRDPCGTLPGKLWQRIVDAQLRMDETALHQVKALGFQPEDVKHIVLTHLDFDHAGGIPDFPGAYVHVFAPEYTAAMTLPARRDRMRYAPRQFVYHRLWEVHDVEGDRWYGFDAVTSLKIPGAEVLLIPLPGHSRGHCGVAVETDEGWLLHCGDAAFYHGELDSPRRHGPLGLRLYQDVFQWKRGPRLANQERLRELVQKRGRNIQVICSHDPEMMTRAAAAPAREAVPAAASSVFAVT